MCKLVDLSLSGVAPQNQETASEPGYGLVYTADRVVSENAIAAIALLTASTQILRWALHNS